jgi:sortase A
MAGTLLGWSVAEVGAVRDETSAVATRSGPIASTLVATDAVPPPTRALPVPEDAPEDPYADVPVVAIGQIEIPRIGLVHTLYEGIALTVLDHGPGHWPGSAAPGGWGNVVIGGHRATHDHPFRRIGELEPGDLIVLRADGADGGTFTYEVTGSRVVTPADMWIVTQHPGRTITLFACHPPGSAEYRYVVFGRLVGAPDEPEAP